MEKFETVLLFVCLRQEEKDQQWKRAMDYLSAVSELNYMTQIVIMLYEDNNKVESSMVLFYLLLYLILKAHLTSKQTCQICFCQLNHVATA